MTPPNSVVVVIGMSWGTLFFDLYTYSSEYSFAAKPLHDRASFGEPSRRTWTRLMHASMRQNASLTKSHGTSARSVASRSASRSAWQQIVSILFFPLHFFEYQLHNDSLVVVTCLAYQKDCNLFCIYTFIDETICCLLPPAALSPPPATPLSSPAPPPGSLTPPPPPPLPSPTSSSGVGQQ